MYVYPRRVSSHEEDSRLEQDQESLHGNSHNRPFSEDPMFGISTDYDPYSTLTSVSSPNRRTEASSSGTGRTVGETNQPSRLSQALAGTPVYTSNLRNRRIISNSRQILSTSVSPTTGTLGSNEDDRAESALLSYFRSPLPSVFPTVDYYPFSSETWSFNTNSPSQDLPQANADTPGNNRRSVSQLAVNEPEYSREIADIHRNSNLNSSRPGFPTLEIQTPMRNVTNSRISDYGTGNPGEVLRQLETAILLDERTARSSATPDLVPSEDINRPYVNEVIGRLEELEHNPNNQSIEPNHNLLALQQYYETVRILENVVLANNNRHQTSETEFSDVARSDSPELNISPIGSEEPIEIAGSRYETHRYEWEVQRSPTRNLGPSSSARSPLRHYESQADIIERYNSAVGPNEEDPPLDVYPRHLRPEEGETREFGFGNNGNSYNNLLTPGLVSQERQPIRQASQRIPIIRENHYSSPLPSFLTMGLRGPHSNSLNTNKVLVTKSTRQQMQAKSVSWVRSGIKFQGKFVPLPRREFMSRERNGREGSSGPELNVEFRVRRVDIESNRVTCILKPQGNGEDAHVTQLWEGEMLEAPNITAHINNRHNDDRRNSYNVTKYWNKLFSYHSLNGTSLLWKIKRESIPSSSNLKRRTIPRVAAAGYSRGMSQIASEDYVWLLLNRVPEGVSPPTCPSTKGPNSRMLLSVRRSDGSIEGCFGKSTNNLMLFYAEPDNLSQRGGIADVRLI